METIKISQLITEALTNPDPDIQYMRAEELTSALLNHYSQPPKGIADENQQKLINECYRVFYQHLQSQYREVQGNAIKQFQKLAPQMRGPEVKYIAGELLKSSIESQPEYRENYYICLQEIVEKVPYQVQTLGEAQETIIKKLGELKQAVKQLQGSKQIVHQEIQHNIEVQAELLKILSQIMFRWPQLCQKDFSDLLIDNIANQNELSIRKNSCVCLGYLGQCLSQQALITLIQQKILPELREQKYDHQSYNRCFFMTQSLNYLAKSSGKQFDKNLVEQVYQLFFNSYHTANSVDFDNINQFAELLEIQLLTVIYLISNTNARLFDVKLLEQITPLIDYDPMGVAAIEVEDNPYEEEYYADDAADSTWRVRRGAIFTYQELLKVQPQLFKFILSALFGQNQIIMRRFNEKNNEIKSAIVSFYLTLVQASAIKENAQMELEDLQLIKQRSIPSSISILELVEQLLEKIQSIFSDPNEQQSLKSEASKLLLAVGQYFSHQIHLSNDCFQLIVKIIDQSITGSQTNYSNEQKIAAILTLKTVIKIADPLEFHVPIFQQIIDTLLEAANQKYIRIQTEGYNTLEIVIKVIKQHFQYQSFKNGFFKLKENLIQRIKIDNLDQDVKQSLFITASTLLKLFGELFIQQEIDQLAQISIVRLQIEALTNQILGLSQNLRNLSEPQNLILAIANLLQRSNKSQIYYCLISLIQNNPITQQIANEIVGKIKQITPENYDLQIHVLQLLINITGIKLSEQFIIDSVKFGLQQGKIKPEIEDFFSIVANPKLIEQVLTKNLNKEELYPAGQIYCSILKQVNGSLSNLYQNIQVNRQLKLSALRFLHRYQQDPNANAILCKFINENQDADLAALALGSAVTSVEQLQELIQQNPNQYQFYVALKEYSELNQIQNISKATAYILNQVVDKDKIIAIVCGDILGGFIKQNYQAIEKYLFEGLKSPHSTVRLSCVQSLKYSSQWIQQGQLLLKLLEKEKDIHILSGIVKALTQNISNLKLTNLAEYLSYTLRRFEERELDFGNFKEKRDDAKDLRSLSFDLLELGVEKQILDLKKAATEVFEKIADDKFDETRIPRLRIILKLMKSDQKLVIQYVDVMIKAFGPVLQAIAINLSKQEKNLEKEIEKIKMIVQIVDGLRSVSKEMDDFYKKSVNQQIAEFVK